MANRLESILCHYTRANEVANLKQHQSKTYEQAVENYQKRYKRDPPQGFDEWFKFALENKGRNIDNYDNVHATLKQFRHLSSAKIRANLKLISDRTDHLQTFRIRNGKVTFDRNRVPELVQSMDKIFSPIASLLPDIDFILNWDDLESLYGGEFEGMDKMDKIESIHDDKWALMTASCPNDFVGKTILDLDRPSIDLCKHLNSSSFIRQRREFFMDAGTMKNRVPIFSWSKYSTSRDFLVPYWASVSNNYRYWDSEDSINYDAKKDTIFWRGSATGSAITKESWRMNHRVQAGQYFNDIRYALSQQQQGNLTSTDVGLLLEDLSLDDSRDNRVMFERLRVENFDAGLSRFQRCSESDKTCSFIGRYIPLLSPTPAPQAERESKIVFDIDGNSMSARYYRMLESNSLVFKNTLMAEWHDDFLIPWFHYIPIDMTSPHQLVQLVDFFLNDIEGKNLGRKIASNSRETAKQMIRITDISIYWYRVLLEYSTLFY